MIDSHQDEQMPIERVLKRFRWFLGPLPCLFGIHNWEPPRAVNGITLSGERTEDGWETTVDNSPNRRVTQHCQHCSRYRERPDLDWVEIAATQSKETEEEIKERIGEI